MTDRLAERIDDYWMSLERPNRNVWGSSSEALSLEQELEGKSYLNVDLFVDSPFCNSSFFGALTEEAGLYWSGCYFKGAMGYIEELEWCPGTVAMDNSMVEFINILNGSVRCGTGSRDLAAIIREKNDGKLNEIAVDCVEAICNNPDVLMYRESDIESIRGFWELDEAASKGRSGI